MQKRFYFKVYIFCFLGLMVNFCFAGQTHAQDEQKGIILVAFGTSMPQAKVALDAIEQIYVNEFADSKTVIMAYSSDFIRNKLNKQKQQTLSIYEAMQKAHSLGITHLRMQSLHVGVAEEFQYVQRIIQKYLNDNPKHFQSIVLGSPLLESEKDMQDLMKAVIDDLPKERKPEDAVLLMAHGNHNGPGDLIFFALAKAFAQKDANIFIASVEGSNTLEKVLVQFKAKKIKKVWLQPLMIVAGDHALNDLFGKEEDSWASILNSQGFTTQAIQRGLGENKNVQQIFLRHTRESKDDFCKSKKSDLKL